MLLKGVDDRGFVFYTNYQSRKAREIEATGRASLLFTWRSLERQVRIDGIVEKVSAGESDAYFASRESSPCPSPVPARIRSVMVIGHNPGLQDLALLLARNGSDELHTKFPTAALATLAFDSPGWTELDRGTVESAGGIWAESVPAALERGRERAGTPELDVAVMPDASDLVPRAV